MITPAYRQVVCYSKGCARGPRWLFIDSYNNDEGYVREYACDLHVPGHEHPGRADAKALDPARFPDTRLPVAVGWPTATSAPSSTARAHVETIVRYCQDNMCAHCGRLPDADGDHSCPCPYSDAECPDHPAASERSPSTEPGSPQPSKGDSPAGGAT